MTEKFQSPQPAERKAAEQAYATTAFNYPEAPIGSRDWCLFWDGWRIRAAMGATPAPTQALTIERDEQMGRDYIPLPGGWELQTKGNGSTLRLLDKKAGERHPLPLPDFIIKFIERMAREVNAASAIPAPEGAPAALDVERLIRECLPGGHSCDPQAVADSIRAWATSLDSAQHSNRVAIQAPTAAPEAVGVVVTWRVPGGAETGVEWVDVPPPEGTKLYAAPQPAPAPSDREAALCDRAYVAGAQAGFAMGSTGDEAGFAKLVGSRADAVAVLKATRAPAPAAAPAAGDEMLEPLIYAAIMHHGKPQTVAQFERAAASVASMLRGRAIVMADRAARSQSLERKPLTDEQFYACMQRDVPGWTPDHELAVFAHVVRHAIERAHNITAPGGEDGKP